MLVHQIETRLFERQGKALSSFERTLPAPQSDLARQLLKDRVWGKQGGGPCPYPGRQHGL